MMLPWGHFAVGYLCYSLGVRLHTRMPPVGTAVIALALGTQFPDLIDKPLAWTVGVLPSGRSFGHSLLFALVLGAVIWLVARRFDRQTEGLAFMTGVVIHTLADAAPAALGGNWDRIGFLLWPMIPVYHYPGESNRSIIEFFLEMDLTGVPIAGVVFAILALGLWVYDGMPGLRTVTQFG